jgi:hypothetical protein
MTDDARGAGEVRYDDAADATVIAEAPDAAASPGPAPQAGGVGCHSGAELTRAAGQASADLLASYAADYPKGPHDKPQSMCPAFGSLRVGLRMRRVATILSGSACCVYGLTFVSHFYGARRSVGYVPFNSETLVTGKLFEDIRDAVHATADPAKLDAIVVTNLCVPTASGVPLRLCRQAGLVHRGRRRNHLSRRDRRHAFQNPGQIAARPAGTRSDARGRNLGRKDRRAHPGGHQRGFGRGRVA